MLKTAGAGGIGVLMGASGLGGFLSLTEAAEVKEQNKRFYSFLRKSSRRNYNGCARQSLFCSLKYYD